MRPAWKEPLAAVASLVGTGLVWGVADASAQPAAYRNRDLPIEQRAADLLQRMTLEEKVEQLVSPPVRHIIDVTGRYDDAFAQKVFPEALGPGPTLSTQEWAILRNAAQRYQLERTRLGIPLLFRGEGLHGFMSHGATSFPQALALASTWDPDLVRDVFTVVADEMSAAGVHQAFTPVLDLARDPRWGRTEETYGEDPYLVTRIGTAAIEGLQGSHFLIDRRHVIATAKHFAAHGQPESGINMAPGNYSERVLRTEHLAPFQAAVQQTRVGSVMASYNEIDGVPSHGNPWLLDTVLRQEWGYGGYVIADHTGLQRLVSFHHVARDNAEAARLGLSAGVDLDDVDGSAYRTLVDQVRQGTVPEALVDRAAQRVILTKLRLGLFDEPYVDPERAARITGSPEHRALALLAAERAIVLLKNDGPLLPLALERLRRIAVIGPNAADLHLGGYSREPAHGVSVLVGIRAHVGSAATVLYAEGCRITEGQQGWRAWYEDQPRLPDPEAEQRRIAEAAEVARQADVAIVVVGENESTNREAWHAGHPGDRDSLDLVGHQDQLIKAIVETGTPTVVFLIGGRPLSIAYAAEHVPAILVGWYLGQETGTAAARVLFGDANPGGRLPITFPRSVGQLPAYYYRKPSNQMSYLFADRKPLFPFGWGLSYTTFRYQNLRLVDPTIGAGGDTTVSVDVTNTGSRAGDEVVQMYVHQRVSSVTRAVIQLKGFKRVRLNPGETRTVSFKVGAEELKLLNRDMRWVVEPGVFDIMVGASSVDTASVALSVVSAES